MQFDLDLVFQIKNIEIWYKFSLDNDPQKNKVSYRDRPTVFNNGQIPILNSDLHVPLDKAKMNVDTPKPLENIQGKTSFWQKRQKLETNKQRLWLKVHRLRQAHLKVAGLNQFYGRSAPPHPPFNTIVRDK
jgi:hypothetical protein